MQVVVRMGDPAILDVLASALLGNCEACGESGGQFCLAQHILSLNKYMN